MLGQHNFLLLGLKLRTNSLSTRVWLLPALLTLPSTHSFPGSWASIPPPTNLVPIELSYFVYAAFSLSPLTVQFSLSDMFSQDSSLCLLFPCTYKTLLHTLGVAMSSSFYLFLFFSICLHILNLILMPTDKCSYHPWLKIKETSLYSKWRLFQQSTTAHNAEINTSQ